MTYKEAPRLPSLSSEGIEIRQPSIAPRECALPENQKYFTILDRYFKSQPERENQNEIAVKSKG